MFTSSAHTGQAIHEPTARSGTASKPCGPAKPNSVGPYSTSSAGKSHACSSSSTPQKSHTTALTAPHPSAGRSRPSAVGPPTDQTQGRPTSPRGDKSPGNTHPKQQAPNKRTGPAVRGLSG